MDEVSNPGRRGLMLVLSSPSGAGKSTLARRLLDTDGAIGLSVSVTTRARRGSEVDGVDYHFVTMEEFARQRDSDELLESAEVHGNMYGTPRARVESALTAGQDVLFDIDWQGTQQLAAAMPEDVVRVFILPPTMAELEQRLRRRAEDSEEVIARRVANARDELSHWREYDYVVVNDDMQRALEIVQVALAGEREKRWRSTTLEAFVNGLLAA